MKTLLAVLAPAALLVSCANVTPQGRIERHPGLYATLSAKDKQLVQHGTIDRGMSMDAVWLAWGEPASKFYGAKGAQPLERWIYTSSEPVYTTNFFGGVGIGSYGPYRSRSYGYGFGPEIAYVPRTSATVVFVNRKVDSWERRR
ncbi:hypothetical protein [Luteolibacter sp. LG18]|uniref:hypothetical protein n=1 Tax=Luteolibacter sp. LG18 TaxID=2819286 RepID=UPI002B2C557E|nr:hypothetical protein llg_41880 [Luteolibacter sp. LG18]